VRTVRTQITLINLGKKKLVHLPGGSGYKRRRSHHGGTICWDNIEVDGDEHSSVAKTASRLPNASSSISGNMVLVYGLSKCRACRRSSGS
jgi:hypothetical protein